MKLTEFNIDDLAEYPGNYNRHPESQIQELQQSIKNFGQYKNVVVWNMFVIAGWGFVTAAKAKGLLTIWAVDRSDLTEPQAVALLIADNATPAGALPDISDLSSLLSNFDDPLDIPGVTDDWMAALNIDMAEGIEPEPEKESPEEFPEYDEEIETEYCCPKCSYAWSGKPK